MFDFVLKGANASQLEKDIGSDLFPANEHFFGLVNVSISYFETNLLEKKSWKWIIVVIHDFF